MFDSIVYTDSLSSYDKLDVSGFIHHRINHCKAFAECQNHINSTWRDKLLLVWILVTLVLGLSTICVSAGHMDGHEMTLLMQWAQHIVTFRGVEAASFITDAHILFKLHMFMGMTFFLIFPFTRMVHVWSGFASVFYVFRPWQLVRRR